MFIFIIYGKESERARGRERYTNYAYGLYHYLPISFGSVQISTMLALLENDDLTTRFYTRASFHSNMMADHLEYAYFLQYLDINY